MSTQYSDIYIDGITTEELSAEGEQIAEVWLNGECIWRLIDGLEGYWRHIFCWTRYKTTNYGFGGYEPENIFVPKYTLVYFYGNDVENMLFFKHQASGFSDGTIISAYDFGICTFSSSAIGALSFEVDSTGTYKAEDFPERLEPVNNFLGDEFVNIPHPLGASCNVFSHRYHIYSRDYNTGGYRTGAAVIKDVLNNTEKIFAFSTPINGDYFALGPCAYFKGKIYFPGRKITYYHTDTTSIIPLFYINEREELSYIELAVSPFWSAHVGGVDANESRIVWTLHTHGASENTYLCEYNGAGAKCSLVYETRVISGAKLVGQYIVLYGFSTVFVNGHLTNYGIYAGKTIYDMTRFTFRGNDYGLDYENNTSTKNSAVPRVFYEENGELFFDIIFTQDEQYPTKYTGNSYVLKMKPNFDTGKIDEVSRTEINGKLEE